MAVEESNIKTTLIIAISVVSTIAILLSILIYFLYHRHIKNNSLAQWEIPPQHPSPSSKKQFNKLDQIIHVDPLTVYRVENIVLNELSLPKDQPKDADSDSDTTLENGVVIIESEKNSCSTTNEVVTTVINHQVVSSSTETRNVVSESKTTHISNYDQVSTISISSSTSQQVSELDSTKSNNIPDNSEKEAPVIENVSQKITPQQDTPPSFLPSSFIIDIEPDHLYDQYLLSTIQQPEPSPILEEDEEEEEEEEKPPPLFPRPFKNFYSPPHKYSPRIPSPFSPYHNPSITLQTFTYDVRDSIRVCVEIRNATLVMYAVQRERRELFGYDEIGDDDDDDSSESDDSDENERCFV